MHALLFSEGGEAGERTAGMRGEGKEETREERQKGERKGTRGARDGQESEREAGARDCVAIFEPWIEDPTRDLPILEGGKVGVGELAHLDARDREDDRVHQVRDELVNLRCRRR